MERRETADFVRQHLARLWSPDQIAGRLRTDFPKQPARHISPQTIYTWMVGLPNQEERQRFRSFLRRAGKRRPINDRRGTIPAAVSIEGRPKVVDQRRRYGDWEGDTIVGAGRRGALLTLVDRKSGYLMMSKSCDSKAKRIGGKIRRRLGQLPTKLRRTLTLDNGKEFADHQNFSKALQTNVYFAAPYKSWQRGTNENTNGLVRQNFPKGTDFRQISWQEVERVETAINDRPRKRLGYRAPSEVHDKIIAIET